MANEAFEKTPAITQSTIKLDKCPLCGKTPRYAEGHDLIYCDDCDTLLSWLREASTYAILGEPGSGKSLFLYRLMRFYLTNQRPIIYLSLDDLPSQIRGGLDKFVHGYNTYEEQGTFIFIDG